MQVIEFYLVRRDNYKEIIDNLVNALDGFNGKNKIVVDTVGGACSVDSGG